MIAAQWNAELIIGTILNCSREFTHRVKSVSMAKFTSQEVSALQGGGNAVWMHIFIIMISLILFVGTEKNNCNLNR